MLVWVGVELGCLLRVDACQNILTAFPSLSLQFSPPPSIPLFLFPSLLLLLLLSHSSSLSWLCSLLEPYSLMLLSALPSPSPSLILPLSLCKGLIQQRKACCSYALSSPPSTPCTQLLLLLDYKKQRVPITLSCPSVSLGLEVPPIVVIRTAGSTSEC